MRIIGDTHGNWNWYVSARGNRSSLHVGDFGFGFLHQIQSVIHDDMNDHKDLHRFIRGNHDDPAIARTTPGYLGDFGNINTTTGKLFFVSGAWSIDQQYRVENISWWREEELSFSQMDECLKLYTEIKPDFVVTHDCPIGIVQHVNKSNLVFETCTGNLLQAMFETHAPRTWVFGHHHVNRVINTKITQFVCVASDDYREISEFGEWIS